MHFSSRKAFTLLEVLVVAGIVAILAIVVVITLNPIQLLEQSRDADRVSDMSTLNKAVALYHEDAMNHPSTMFMGTSSIIYLSVPDPTATTTAGTNCSGIGLGLPSTGYHCPWAATYRNVNGAGWIPIDFASSTFGSSISALSVDPINTAASGEYYEYTTDGAGNWQIVSVPESQKYSSLAGDFSAGTTKNLLGPITYTTSTYSLGNYTPTGGIAFDSHTNTMWVANQYYGNHVTQINDTTYATSSYSVGNFPLGVAFDSHTNTIWVANDDDNTVTQINDTTYVASTYAVGITPSGIAFDSHTNTIWVANEDDNTVTQINDTTYATSTYAVGIAPGGVAFDPHTNTLWVVNSYSGTVTQINDTTYATSTYAVGIDPQYDVFDPHANTVWVLNSNNFSSSTITQINDTTYASTTFPVGYDSRNLTFNPHTNTIWVVNSTGPYTNGTVTQINDTAPYATSTYSAGEGSIGVGFDSHTNTIWVPNSTGENVMQFIPNR